MVWKINKNRRSERRVSKEDLERQAKLKSCLRPKDDLPKQRNSSIDSSKLVLDDGSFRKGKERSVKSTSSNGARTSNSNLSVDSKGSGSSSILGLSNKKRIASEQRSIGSRSWDRDSRRSAAQSTQTSERSSLESRSPTVEIKKRVQFSSLHIRDYERVVGDNPSCTIGPPVGIGWKYNEARVIDIEAFESARRFKKSGSRLVLSREEREALLLNWGASFHDIVESVRGNIKIKNQRRQTVTNLGKVERIEEAFESATRKLKSALMLRRSTGNKLKQLQEQANLAQSALTSLKIAEDRALSQLRGPSHYEAEEETNSEEDFETYPLSDYHTGTIEDNEVVMVSEDEDHRSGRYSATGNSTTKSETEIERFHRELELEMFGEEDIPSMVGQTLEVRRRGEKGSSRADDRMIAEDVSVASGMTERYSVDGFDEELLEKEQNRSMISEYLLEDADNDISKAEHAIQDQGEQDTNQYYYSSQPAPPMHEDQEAQKDHFGWGSMGATGFSNWNDSSEFVESKETYTEQQKATVPLHAGMTMFDDCALLGDAAKSKSKSYRRERRRSSRSSRRKKDTNAGPKIHYIPPPTHFSPSHWMDSPDPNSFSSRGHDTITISEDIFHDRTQMERQYYNNASYNNNGYGRNFY